MEEPREPTVDEKPPEEEAWRIPGETCSYHGQFIVSTDYLFHLYIYMIVYMLCLFNILPFDGFCIEKTTV